MGADDRIPACGETGPDNFVAAGAERAQRGQHNALQQAVCKQMQSCLSSLLASFDRQRVIAAFFPSGSFSALCLAALFPLASVQPFST
jgi:hypothetical protein